MRRLKRAPGFTLAAVATLALGIGADAAIFSVVEAVMLHPLPYPQPQRLVEFTLQGRIVSGLQSLDLLQFDYLRRRLRGVAAMAAYQPMGEGESDLVVDGHSHWVSGLAATDGIIRALGWAPLVGRGIVAADTAPGAAGVIVITDQSWKRALSGDPGVVGRVVTVDGHADTIVGVLPPDFAFHEQRVDFVEAMRRSRNPLQDDGMNEAVIARMAPGVGLAALQA
ncbi:MAG: ABC transporter permease, partial [Terriglobales bacterium]